MGYLKDFLKKIWTKGLLHILAGTFMTKLVGFFGSIFLVRVLSKWEYGILGYLENIYGYIFIFAGLGMSNAILRYVVLGKTQEEKYSYYSYAVSRGRTYNILLIAAALLVAWLYPHPEAYREWTWLLAVLGLAIPFQYTADNVLCNERAMFANQRYAAMSLLLSFSIIVTKIISGKAAGIQIVGGTVAHLDLVVFQGRLQIMRNGLFAHELRVQHAVVDRQLVGAGLRGAGHREIQAL